jgi:hypothetical protein
MQVSFFNAVSGLAQKIDETKTVRNRSRQRPGGFPEITRLLAQAVPYQIDSSRPVFRREVELTLQNRER